MVNKINTLKKKNKPKKLHKGKNRKYSKGINKNIKDGLSLKKIKNKKTKGGNKSNKSILLSSKGGAPGGGAAPHGQDRPRGPRSRRGRSAPLITGKGTTQDIY